MTRWSGTASDDGAEVRAGTPTPPADPLRLTRRRFCQAGVVLGGWGVVAGGAAWAIGPGRPDFEGRESIFDGTYGLDDPANVRTTTCLGCFGACPVRVSVVEGAIARLDGNPWSPRTWSGEPPKDAAEAAKMRGPTCARGQARLQNTHDPLRLVRTLVRAGSRGGGAWRSLTGDEARQVLSTGHDGRPGLAGLPPGDLAVLVDPRQADRTPLVEAFTAAFQALAPAVHLGHAQPWVAEAAEAFLGEPGWTLDPHWDRATGLLAWGADPVASGPDPVGDSMRLASWRRSRQHRPVVVVDPRLSETAARADWWLPVRPGGDRALAVMILVAWLDQGAVSLPDAVVQALRSRPMADLERIAGLGEAAVREVAEVLATCGSGLAIRVGGGVGERPDRRITTEAALRLGAVLGALGTDGAMAPRRLPARPGQRPVDVLPTLPAPRVLVVVGDGGLPDTPAWPRLRERLLDPARTGLLVVVTPTMNPVAALADVILPDRTELERSGLVRRNDGTSVVRPVVTSLLSSTGLEAPFHLGFEGFLDLAAQEAGIPFSSDAAIQAALADPGLPPDLAAHGWIPAVSPATASPTVDPFRPDADLDAGHPVDGLVLVSYREPFAGFGDSSAQYWAQPSLRRGNPAWIHPETAAALGVENGHRLAFGDHLAQVRVTEEVRPGVVALATGYGHLEGHDGLLRVDGRAVPRDLRRAWGVDVGALATEDGTVDPRAKPPAGPQSVRELLMHAMEHRERT